MLKFDRLLLLKHLPDKRERGASDIRFRRLLKGHPDKGGLILPHQAGEARI